MNPLCSICILFVLAAVADAQTPPPSASPEEASGTSEAASKPRTKIHTDSVVVTGNPAPLPLSEADRSVTVYEVPSRALLLGNLAAVLQLDSSVDLKQRAPGVQADISIRGGSFGQTLVLLNGIRVNDAQSAHHNFDVPAPLDAISQIEILRGSGSTLYGSDAVAGVVNVLTRVQDSTELVFRSGVGNFGTNVQGGFLSLLTGRVTQQFSFERELSTGFRDDREYRNLAGSYQANVRTSLGTTRVFLSGLDRPFGADQFYGNYTSWERTKTWFASLHQDLGDRTDVSLAYRRHSDLFVLTRDDPEFYTNRHVDDTWYGAIRRHDTLGRAATLFYGGEGIADSVNSTNLGNHQRQRGAGYADLDIRALRRFSLLAGAREEVYGSGQTVFAPSLSAGYWLNSKAKLRASVTRAFRLPNFTDLYYHDPANLGNPFLKPERATNYEGGIDFYPTASTKLSATIFQRREKDDIDYVRSSANDPWRATNFDQLHFTGAELAMEARFKKTQLVQLQYTGLHGSQTDLGSAEAKYLFSYPRQEAIATWQIVSAKGLLARTRIGVINRYNQSAYALWDFDLAWRERRVRPYLQLRNLSDTSYEEIVGVAMPGRSALIGVELCLVCPRL